MRPCQHAISVGEGIEIEVPEAMVRDWLIREILGIWAATNLLAGVGTGKLLCNVERVIGRRMWRGKREGIRYLWDCDIKS